MALLLSTSLASAGASFWSMSQRWAACERRHHQPPMLADSTSKWSTPAELTGPWELRTSISGLEETWFELNEDGSVSMSVKAGEGKSWRAERTLDARPQQLDDWMVLQSSPEERFELEQALQSQKSGWRLHVGFRDKMGWPLAIEGDVSEDEYLGTSAKGNLLSPPKQAANKAAAQRLKIVGEFRCFKVKE